MDSTRIRIRNGAVAAQGFALSSNNDMGRRHVDGMAEKEPLTRPARPPSPARGEGKCPDATLPKLRRLNYHDRAFYLYDTTLRDGAQTLGVDFSLEDKRVIAERLDALGIDYIEGGYPGANPVDTAFFEGRACGSGASSYLSA